MQKIAIFYLGKIIIYYLLNSFIKYYTRIFFSSNLYIIIYNLIIYNHFSLDIIVVRYHLSGSKCFTLNYKRHTTQPFVLPCLMSSSIHERFYSWTFARQEAPFARDLSKAARDLTTFEEANAPRAKTSRVQRQSASDAGFLQRLLPGNGLWRPSELILIRS